MLLWITRQLLLSPTPIITSNHLRWISLQFRQLDLVRLLWPRSLLRQSLSRVIILELHQVVTTLLIFSRLPVIMKRVKDL